MSFAISRTTGHYVKQRKADSIVRKSRGLCKCDGQSTYSAEKVDEAVLEIMKMIFSRIADAPDEAELKKSFSKEMQSCRANQTKLNTELKKLKIQYEKLNEEIANSLIGESFYSPEQLSSAINAVNQKITAIESQLEKLEDEMQNKKNSMEKVKPMYEQFKGWAEAFMMATTEQKKMIISQVAKRIEISKGYRIKIEMNLDYKQFCEDWEELNGKEIRVEKG